MLNTILDQKFNSFASTLQNLQAGAKEPPFDKNTLASGHMAFNYILPDGSKKYETVIVYDKNKYNTNPTYKALYDLLDDNEDALL
ncbi:hypothetical protein GW750_04065 [bacterium]|nr:hypothetical protein [bacterium]